MNDRDEIGALLTDWFAAEAPGRAPRRLLESVLAETALRTPRRAWLARVLGLWATNRTRVATLPARPLVLMVILAVLLAGLVGGVLLAGSPVRPAPSVNPGPTTSAPAARLAPEVPLHGNGPIIALTNPGGPGYSAIDPVSGAAVGFPASGTALAWSPDGTKFASIIGNEIWVTTVGASKSLKVTTCCATTLADPRQALGVNWSPDGTQLVFIDHDQIFTIRADGTERIQLSHLEGSIAFDPAWSPDGSRIAFAMNSIPFTPDLTSIGAIATMRLDGTGPVLVTNLGDRASGGIYSSPVWSPDGSRIAYLEGAFPVQVIEVLVCCGESQVVYESPNCCVNDWGDLSWSPDGQQLATILLSPGSARWSLFLIPAVELSRLPNGPSPTPPVQGAAVELVRGVVPGPAAWRPVP
jgi:hypothetical protein